MKIFVGIDIAKLNHFAAAISSDGEILISIKEISESVGYSSHSKFSSCFKKFKGIYPRDVRKLSEKSTHTLGCGRITL